MELTRAPQLPSPCTGDWPVTHRHWDQLKAPTHSVTMSPHPLPDSLGGWQWENGVAKWFSTKTHPGQAKSCSAHCLLMEVWQHGVCSAPSSWRVTPGRGYPQQRSLTAQEAAATFIVKEKQAASQRKCQWSSSVQDSSSYLRTHGKIDLRFSQFLDLAPMPMSFIFNTSLSWVALSNCPRDKLLLGCDSCRQEWCYSSLDLSTGTQVR